MYENSTQVRDYIQRINCVMDYIDRHLGEAMTLEALASVAGFSPYHFHRIFAAMVGETLFGFIGRLRLERSLGLLYGDPYRPVTDVALACGFSSPAAFSRAFSARYGMSPSRWRKERLEKSNTGKEESSLYQVLRNRGNAEVSHLVYDEYMRNFIVRRDSMKLNPEAKVVNRSETTVAYIRHIGPYAGDAKLFEGLYARLYQWAKPRGLVDMEHPEKCAEIIIYHDDPSVTEPEKLRVSAGIVVPADTEVSGEVGKLTIPPGDYVEARFIIGPEDFGEAWGWVCGTWLPASGYQPGDGMCFEQYAHGSGAEKEGKFDVTICLPVKPMK